MFRLVLLLATLMLLACSPTGITISFGVPTATPTFTPTHTPTAPPTATSTATLNFTATAQVQASATAQAEATAQARVKETTAAVIAQSNAQANAAATSQANATAAAKAAAAATKNALLAYVDALVAKAGRPEREREGEIRETKWFWVNGNWKNFVIDVQLSNPADPAVHPWDYGFQFRGSSKDKYLALLLRSDKTWVLYGPEQFLADRTTLKRLGSGTIPQMDVSPTGSNKVRFVTYENSAFLFVNGEFVSIIDISANPSSGELYLITGFLIADNFAGSLVRFKDLSVAGLP